MQDWLIRALKTFVQAFFGVLIPAVCAMLQNGWPENWSKAWVILAPTVSAALAAAICAVWNIILEAMSEKPEQGKHEPTYGYFILEAMSEKPEQGKHEPTYGYFEEDED